MYVVTLANIGPWNLLSEFGGIVDRQKLSPLYLVTLSQVD